MVVEWTAALSPPPYTHPCNQGVGKVILDGGLGGDTPVMGG
jgi:hypothetical protein